MYARTSYSEEEFPSFIVAGSVADQDSTNFFAGEPVCPPSKRRRADIVSYSSLVLLLIATVGCAFASDADTRRDWTAKIERVASTLYEFAPAMPAAQQPPPANVASNAMPLSPPAPPVAPAPPAAQPLPVVTVTSAPGDPPDTDAANAPAKARVSDAYAPPRIQSDAYGRKAEAVGLHPDISRAVLSRLTPADYRNAAYAIQKAIKTVPDDGEFTWPRARKAGTAVFNVHFVQGAARDCRRYVVTITKDRWTSTALPMEKCGVKVAYRTTGKEKSIE